jgi:ABC-type xylose transport system permease subunit
MPALGAIAAVLGVIAAILELVQKHQGAVIDLVIAAVILLGAGMALGYRGGWYRRRTAP